MIGVVTLTYLWYLFWMTKIKGKEIFNGSVGKIMMIFTGTIIVQLVSTISLFIWEEIVMINNGNQDNNKSLVIF